MRRNIARTARSLGGTAVISRPTAGTVASRISSGSLATGAPKVQPSSTMRPTRSGWAAAVRRAR
jgi:hypothetical protein